MPLYLGYSVSCQLCQVLAFLFQLAWTGALLSGCFQSWFQSLHALYKAEWLCTHHCVPWQSWAATHIPVVKHQQQTWRFESWCWWENSCHQVVHLCLPWSRILFLRISHWSLSSHEWWRSLVPSENFPPLLQICLPFHPPQALVPYHHSLTLTFWY